MFVLFQDFNGEREININETSKGVKEKIGLYNTMNIKNVALASLRHHKGLREIAEIATAALIDTKVITEGNTSLSLIIIKLREHRKKLEKS